MIDVLTNNLDAIRAACEEFHVRRLWVFGSAVRDDWDPIKSDVDFIAEFDKSERSLFRQHMGLITALENIVGVRAQVIDVGSIKQEYLRDDTGNTRELLYERAHQTLSA